MNYTRQYKDEGTCYQKVHSLVTLIVQPLREKEITNKPWEGEITEIIQSLSVEHGTIFVHDSQFMLLQMFRMGRICL